MTRDCFDSIVKQAETSEIRIKDYDPLDGDYEEIVRVGFHVVQDGVRSDTQPNFYIQNEDRFFQLLNEYVLLALNKYNMPISPPNIQRIIVRLLANITEEEMLNLESYVEKYIDFIHNEININIVTMPINDKVGRLKGETIVQNHRQETPYAFSSSFMDESGAEYPIPRISYGIRDDTCYVYAIQVKDKPQSTNGEYNNNIKDYFRSINSGIKHYRNVSPSFVVALTFFMAVMSDLGIKKVVVVPKLPLRQQNRQLVAQHKIRFQTMKGDLSLDELEEFKRNLDEQNMAIDFNSTTKFRNCFARLRLHFDEIFVNNAELNEEAIYEIINMQTQQLFLGEIVMKAKEAMEIGRLK